MHGLSYCNRFRANRHSGPSMRDGNGVSGMGTLMQPRPGLGRGWRVLLVLSLLGALLTVGGIARAVDTWQAAASMHFARGNFTLTPLRDGRVLAVGGFA